MENNQNWFAEFKKSEEYKAFEKNPVAYFCAEYALDPLLPTYAGGLGVLAGDYIREAAAQEFPMIAVGLFYQKAQSILSLEENDAKDKLNIITDAEGKEITIAMPFEDRTVLVRAWQWKGSEAKIYLLDTDMEENDPKDREITKQLYDENRDTRLKQEIILGIGGFRLLARLGYHASIYHINEGHSAFLALELVRHEMEHQKVGFHKACKFAQKHLVFTNHTLVPAGQEQFSSEKVAQLIAPCAMEICLNNWEITKLGALEENPDNFSMTTMSFKMSAKSNSVSKLHFEKAKTLWPDQAMENVTNGIFIKRWDKLIDATEENIWEKHLENKKKLLKLVKEKTDEVWGEEDLILAWARRMVSYKQPLLLLDDLKRITEIIKNSSVPVRIIFSGPTVGASNPFIDEIKNIAKEKLKGAVVFIPNYNTSVAEILTAGADIWLNTPVVGNEACGTSGMKAALNGCLNLSTNDGWVGEVKGEDIGWVANNWQGGENIRTLLEKEIIPMYALHLQRPENSFWSKKMMRARNLILEEFSTTRALKEYIEKLYLPALKQKHEHKID